MNIFPKKTEYWITERINKLGNEADEQSDDVQQIAELNAR